MEESLRTLLKKYIKTKKTPLVLAVSGGVDSVVLLHALYEIGYTNVHMAHVDHTIRPESAQDRVLLQQYAHKFHYTVDVLEFDALQEAVDLGENLENYARKKRYDFFEEVQKKYDAQYILTAHHKDDSLESQLMHLIRGAGIYGLQPIIEYDEPRSLLRPLLRCSKDDIYAYAKQHHLEWNEDSTNDDTRLLRNKLRKDIIPQMKEINPKLPDSFHRLGAHLVKVEDYFEYEVQKILGKDYVKDTEFPFEAVQELHEILLEHMLYMVIQSNDPLFVVTEKHLTSIVATLKNLGSGKQVMLTPRITLRRSFDTLVLVQGKEDASRPMDTQEGLSFPCEVTVGSCHITMQKTQRPHKGASVFSLPFCLVKEGVMLRAKQDGDKIVFEKNGQLQHKSLKKYFIEKKVPVHMRSHTILLVSIEFGDVVACIGASTPCFTTSLAQGEYLTVTYTQHEEGTH